MIERALSAPALMALDRARLLPTLVEVSVACGEIARAEAGAAELETITATYTAPALVASAALARGRVELAGDRAEPAVFHLRRACRIWADIDLPIELAQTRLLLSRAYAALGDADAAELAEKLSLKSGSLSDALAFRCARSSSVHFGGLTLFRGPIKLVLRPCGVTAVTTAFGSPGAGKSERCRISSRRVGPMI